MTIHWLDLDTNRYMSSGWRQIRTAMASSTAFFQNVCQLVSTTASPKHPQSLTGLAKASHSVSGVMTRKSISVSSDTMRRRMASNRNVPSENSNADNNMAAPSVMASCT